ncbi:uncharacterized protein UTRI_01681 [Ustilago trichophora]|uniref:Uncharacterized protein n=1 Tax=Ustilago trichophora TaxID=86804 RepID=A0A5C3DX25_9BASI|nr:uncharacterized protein UTRI_01681 [Ustilago trichophora]
MSRVALSGLSDFSSSSSALIAQKDVPKIRTLVGARRRSSRVFAPTFVGIPQGAGTGPLLAHFFDLSPSVLSSTVDSATPSEGLLCIVSVGVCKAFVLGPR